MTGASRGLLAPVVIFLGQLLVPAVFHGLNPDQPTFVDDIAPILHENCASCHQPGEIGPMALRTYGEVRPWARSIARAVESRDMPPWDADPGYGPWKNDVSLEEDQISAILRWVSSGAPRGDGEEPLFESEERSGEWALGEPDWVYEFEPYEVAADGPDSFAVIPIEASFEEDRWIRVVEVQPGDRDVLHHFILWRAAPGGTVQDAWIDGWAAGVAPRELPAGTARLLPKGRNLLGDFHYHPSGTASTDQTRIGVWFAEPDEVEKELVNLWIMNSAFRIPAGDPNHEARAHHVFTEDVLVRSLAPHMHYRGKDMRYTAYLPDGTERELLSVSRYDFNWQTAYEYAEPVALPAGTRMEVVAHWDNSADNPNNPDPTVEVRFGVESTAEMMVGFVDFVAAKGVSPRPVSPVFAMLAELAQTHPGEAWRIDTERYRGKGPEPTALLLPRGGGPGRWFGGEPGNRVVGSPVNDIVWDANHVTATVGRGPTAKIEGFVQDDGSLMLNLGGMGGGAEVRGTPAENEVLVTLPNG